MYEHMNHGSKTGNPHLLISLALMLWGHQDLWFVIFELLCCVIFWLHTTRGKKYNKPQDYTIRTIHSAATQETSETVKSYMFLFNFLALIQIKLKFLFITFISMKPDTVKLNLKTKWWYWEQWNQHRRCYNFRNGLPEDRSHESQQNHKWKQFLLSTSLTLPLPSNSKLINLKYST
jgi:hypothetical protein